MMKWSEYFRKGDVPEIVRATDKHFGQTQYSLRRLFKDEQRTVMDKILEPKYDQMKDTYLAMYRGN